MTAKTLMVLGSMSSAGKSLLVTGLCRLYARRGWRVAPFKAQNMSNNAAVCSGGEIGRAQAVQAQAAGIEPSVLLNPVLLKPQADSRSQVVVRGQVWDTFSARDYYQRRAVLWQAVTESLDALKAQTDLVILEGAGSPAEINLRPNDIVNLAAARYAQAPCLLVGDIDRGGVFAQLLGTLWLLEPAERELIRGLVVNKFRGDPELFADG
ncbi:MAG: cobyric acid synthase, partial [Chloroflexi bacterium]|nr:cobyric acid synthase [Chloroflexota bacterium]